jgi:hypothetical protein
MGTEMASDQVSGVDQVVANFREAAANQIPFAVSLALNKTANEVVAAEGGHATSAFDRPTPFTLNAFGMSPSNKQDLTASVFVKNIQSKYLEVESEGGPRSFKTFEERFTSDGVPQMMMPGAAMPRDQFGNVSKDKIIQIAQALRQGKSSYFIGKPKGGNRPAGVYLRDKGDKKLSPLMIEASTASYQPRFKFHEVAERTFASKFQQNMLDAWGRALSTMK